MNRIFLALYVVVVAGVVLASSLLAYPGISAGFVLRLLWCVALLTLTWLCASCYVAGPLRERMRERYGPVLAPSCVVVAAYAFVSLLLMFIAWLAPEGPSMERLHLAAQVVAAVAFLAMFCVLLLITRLRVGGKKP